MLKCGATGGSRHIEHISGELKIRGVIGDITQQKKKNSTSGLVDGKMRLLPSNISIGKYKNITRLHVLT